MFRVPRLSRKCAGNVDFPFHLLDMRLNVSISFKSTNVGGAVGLTYWIVYLHFLYFDICNYIGLDTSCHFWLYLYFLNIVYFSEYSCNNIFHRRSLCTFYWYLSWSTSVLQWPCHIKETPFHTNQLNCFQET